MNNQSVLIRAKKRHAYACVQSQRWQEAVQFYEEICQYNPEDAGCWFMLGTVRGRLGQMTAAETAMHMAIWLQPDFLQAYVNLGHVLELQGRLEEAKRCYDHALLLKPEGAEIHEALARLYEQWGDLEQAQARCEEAIRLNPQRPAAHLLLGRVLQNAGHLLEAVACYKQALQLDPHSAEVHYHMARAHFDLLCYEDCRREARLAQQARPGYEVAVTLEAEAALRLAQGQSGNRVSPSRSAPVLSAPLPELTRIGALGERSGEGDSQEGKEASSLLVGTVLSRAQQRTASFHLGDLCEKKGEYQQALVHYQAAHDLYSVPDISVYTAVVDQVIALYNHAALARAPRAGNCSERPIFVVGMPGSGLERTTRLLACHPQVNVANEAGLIAAFFAQLATDLRGDPDQALTQLTRVRLDETAERYLAELTQSAPNAKRVIDKTAQNFLYLGAVELLFPTAHVIHCIRDPLDVCLACYTQDWGDSHPYTHDLAGLGHYYRQYRRLMDHWYQVLDLPMLEVNYEELLQNPRKVSRNLTEFCGLKGSSDLLPLSGTRNGPPRSAEAPGYSKHYEPYLRSLKEALGGHIRSDLEKVGRQRS